MHRRRADRARRRCATPRPACRPLSFRLRHASQQVEAERRGRSNARSQALALGAIGADCLRRHPWAARSGRRGFLAAKSLRNRTTRYCM
ncbi:MAG: hypothetical protein MZW92_67655 [Comamonadaceae bacterium]|nr:hypothetical protein [Comamonadaceae bacterium]